MDDCLFIWSVSGLDDELVLCSGRQDDVLGRLKSVRQVVAGELVGVGVHILGEGNVELIEPGGHCDLGDRFEEGLAQTNTLAAEEGREAVGVSLGAAWSKVVRVSCVEAFGDELFGLDPLVCAVAEVEHAYH